MSKKRSVLNSWEFGYLFGAAVIRGWADGRRITAPWHWWTGWRKGGRVGVSRSSNGTEEIFRLGTPASSPFAHLEP